MIISDLYSAKDYCNVCGQTPCNCTHIAEGVNVDSQIKDIDEAIKAKMSVGNKVHHPDHGAGTVHMVSQGGGSMVAKDSAIVKFGDNESLGAFLFENGVQHKLFQAHRVSSTFAIARLEF